MHKVKGSIWIEGESGAFFGVGRMELLEGIQKTGSISKAARSMKMSYRQAWELVKSMNSQAAKPLVDTSVGGSGGGGTRVTPEGEKTLKLFREMQEDLEGFLRSETKKWEKGFYNT